MVEWHEHANLLREENERLRTRLEAVRTEQLREPPRPFPPSRPGKGKEPSTPGDIDLSANDERSSGSSLLPRCSPSPKAAEAQSRKWPPHQSSRSISVTRRRERTEPNRDQHQPTPAHQYVPDWAGGFPLVVPSIYPPFGIAPAPQMIFSSAVRRPQDMLSTPFEQHILDYDPPRGFSIPPFAMYNGSYDPYDHMLHFNQAMILNAGTIESYVKCSMPALRALL